MKSGCLILFPILLSFVKAELLTNRTASSFSTNFYPEIPEYPVDAANRVGVFKCGSAEIILNYGKNTEIEPYVLQGSQWNTTHLTYKILNHPPYLNFKLVRGAIGKAFSLWSEVSSLTFKPTRENAMINIAFTKRFHEDGSPFDGRFGRLGHGFFPNTIFKGALHFDDAEKWSINKPCKGCIDLFQVAAHEIGHVLGLRHTPFTEAVMYEEYTYKRNFRLHDDDINGIQDLYGPP